MPAAEPPEDPATRPKIGLVLSGGGARGSAHVGVLKVMEEYDWPGNIRELQNLLERAVLASNDGVLRLPASLVSAARERAANVPSGKLATLDEVERQHIGAVLKETAGRIGGPGGAAEILGIHPNTLRSRMKKLGIQLDRPARSVRDAARASGSGSA